MLLEKRKDIFVKRGIPALNKKGFEKPLFLQYCMAGIILEGIRMSFAG